MILKSILFHQRMWNLALKIQRATYDRLFSGIYHLDGCIVLSLQQFNKIGIFGEPVLTHSSVRVNSARKTESTVCCSMPRCIANLIKFGGFHSLYRSVPNLERLAMYSYVPKIHFDSCIVLLLRDTKPEIWQYFQNWRFNGGVTYAYAHLQNYNKVLKILTA